MPLRLWDVVARPEWCDPAAMEYLCGDVRDPATVDAALEGVDSVIHAAFASPRRPRQEIESVKDRKSVV